MTEIVLKLVTFCLLSMFSCFVSKPGTFAALGRKKGEKGPFCAKNDQCCKFLKPRAKNDAKWRLFPKNRQVYKSVKSCYPWLVAIGSKAL